MGCSLWSSVRRVLHALPRHPVRGLSHYHIRRSPHNVRSFLPLHDGFLTAAICALKEEGQDLLIRSRFPPGAYSCSEQTAPGSIPSHSFADFFGHSCLVRGAMAKLDDTGIGSTLTEKLTSSNSVRGPLPRSISKAPLTARARTADSLSADGKASWRSKRVPFGHCTTTSRETCCGPRACPRIRRCWRSSCGGLR